MPFMEDDVRQRSFGQDHIPSVVDRWGIWLSARRLRRTVGSFEQKAVVDAGCGYHAEFGRTLLSKVRELTLIDVSLAPELRDLAKVNAIEGALPQALAGLHDATMDMVICNSVLEHLWTPTEALTEFHRILRPGGVCFVNVPSWRGKAVLELSAFRLGLSPAEEMDDHKCYYDPRDLWPQLVRAGFRSHDIVCRRHKFTLNTFAVCRKAVGGTAP